MIQTARLTLRPARASDLDALHSIFSDPDAMRFWDRPAYTDISDTQRFLDHFMHGDPGDREEYILDMGGRCIGKAGCWRRAEVGYILHPDVWGQGLASEALRAILPRCFDKFAQCSHLTAEVDPRNAPSIHLLSRLGFRQVRTEKKNFLYGGSEWCDTAYFEAARADFDGAIKTQTSRPVRPG